MIAWDAVGFVISMNTARMSSFARGTPASKASATPASVRTVPRVSVLEVACARVYRSGIRTSPTAATSVKNRPATISPILTQMSVTVHPPVRP